ncbi:MAG: hypothetical protein KDD22_09060 [Bdellovibrionales bacterium]|nr:hypothetical protein [Bdellovibrionales bacterium]
MSNTKPPSSRQPFALSRRSVIYDKVNPTDFLKLDITYACEQCSHFDTENERCTIGYDCSLHRRKAQLKMYELSGRMAFCRFCEID